MLHSILLCARKWRSSLSQFFICNMLHWVLLRACCNFKVSVPCLNDGIFSKTSPGLPPQVSNPAQSSAIPLMSQQQTRQPNASTSVQDSLPSLGQSLPGVIQTSTLQNISGMSQNTMNNGLAQGTPQDMYSAQRQMEMLIYQQKEMLMNQKFISRTHSCSHTFSSSNLYHSQH